jgi:octaprenyl-diphosphate synthase
MLKQMQLLVADDLQKVDNKIRNDLCSNIALINQIGEYLIKAGGKRIRPLLTLICGRLMIHNNYHPDDEALLHNMAVMIEYIHTATLLHDDVVDESNMRRGIKTANAVYGNAASVLVGDFIYTRAFQLMTKSNKIEILNIMANATNLIAEGEVLQLLNISNINITEQDYLDIIKCKTAILFAVAAQVATVICNAPITIQTALYNYANNLGYAFQIIDDILDYMGEEAIIGKNIGDDLLEGKVTLPLIYLLSNSSQDIKQKLHMAIKEPTTADVNDIIKIIKNSNAINYCRDMADKYVNQALAQLTIFPESEYKTSLINLTQISIHRQQ